MKTTITIVATDLSFIFLTNHCRNNHTFSHHKPHYTLSLHPPLTHKHPDLAFIFLTKRQRKEQTLSLSLTPAKAHLSHSLSEKDLVFIAIYLYKQILHPRQRGPSFLLVSQVREAEAGDFNFRVSCE
ncbi:hypothetical protein NC651_036869 [Populus alba x Populus x berolinensis]|nr:hypothetical protein NC651_036869 [Populus alba x Populus x berolinensis]